MCRRAAKPVRELQVFLEFEEPYWEQQLSPETQQFGVVLAEDATSRGFCSNFWNFKPFTGANILCGLLTGTSATEMEGLEDAAIVERAKAVLRTVFPSMPEPVRTSVTRWGEDPFAKGSYSFVGVGCKGDHYDLMARPVGRTLLFCGEGTSKEHLDTVGGAMLTGQREVRACTLRGRGPQHAAHTCCRVRARLPAGIAAAGVLQCLQVSRCRTRGDAGAARGLPGCLTDRRRCCACRSCGAQAGSQKGCQGQARQGKARERT
jgi:Flavin containing amine oxidoreductase